MELAVDQIVGCDYAAEPFDTGRAGQAVDSSESHQDRHRARADRDPHFQSQLGMNASIPVGVTGGDMDLTDQSGQPLPAWLGGCDRFSLVLVVILALTGSRPAVPRSTVCRLVWSARGDACAPRYALRRWLGTLLILRPDPQDNVAGVSQHLWRNGLRVAALIKVHCLGWSAMQRLTGASVPLRRGHRETQASPGMCDDPSNRRFP